MKARVWSEPFDIRECRGYLTDDNVDTLDNLKIGDSIYMFGRYKCVVKDICILNNELSIQVEVVDIV